LSDRSGAEYLWVARVDGTEALQISVRNDNPIFVTPAWSADGSSIYVCEFRAHLSSYELWKFAARAGGAGERIIPSKPSPSARADEFVSTLGVTASRDGRFIYYARHTGRIELGQIPQRTIKRREQETGPVRARIIPTPEQSPDGRRLVFSALAHLWIMDLDGRSRPRRLEVGEQPAFMPSWSPDGHDIVYVTWTARDGGHLWRIAADRPAPPVRLTQVPAFYTSPVYTPDRRTIVALRSSHYLRMHAYLED